MSAFDDIETDDTVTSVGISTFTDAVASRDTQRGGDDRYRELQDDGTYRTYQSSDGERGADDVDPRQLYRAPTINELRWYYREGPFGATVVEKPIRDAFKNGYEVINDPSNSVRPFLEEYVPTLIDAEIKARRDGFAVIYFQLRDDADVSSPPSNVREISRYRLLTVDKLTDDISPTVVADNFDEYDNRQISVLDEDGIVIVDDVTHPNHGTLLGYGRETHDGSGPVFIHADRCQHFAWRKHVDGPVDEQHFGKFQGDSVLTPVIHSLKAAHKGVWGMGQTLFRYSAPLLAVETPKEYGTDDFDKVDNQMHNLNVASSVTLPPGTSLDSHDAASEFDPEPFYDALVENICAGTVFTKSVLKGTQTGTVSGSETDVKGYFSEVVSLQNNRLRSKMDEAVQMAFRWNQSIIPSFSMGYGVEWEPVFKLDALDKAEAMTRTVTAVTNGMNNYLMAPETAQSILEESWANIDVEVDLEELTEAEKDDIDRIVLQKGKQYPGGSSPEEEIEGNPRVGQNTETPPNEGPTDETDPSSA